MANVTVSLYDGCLDVNFDCIGEARCAHVKFYTDPPQPDAECAFRECFACTHGPAQRAALENLKMRIVGELLAGMAEKENFE